MAKAKKSAVPSASALASKAMLVKLTFHCWRVTKTDRQVSSEVAQQHQAVEDAGSYRKKLMDYAVTSEISSAVTRLRAMRDFCTLPWEDGGWRILSAAKYFDFVKKVNAGREEVMAAVEKFLADYPAHVANEKKRQGSMFDETQYPTADQIRSKYGVGVAFSKISDGEDIRIDVGEQELAKIRSSAKEAAQATLEAAVGDIWARLAAVVSKMVERLNAYAVTAEGKVQNSFRDSLVTNIEDLLEVVPALNITGDPAIDAFAAKIKAQLTAHSAEVLRDDEKVRKTVAAQAEDILAKMQAYLG